MSKCALCYEDAKIYCKRCNKEFCNITCHALYLAHEQYEYGDEDD